MGLFNFTKKNKDVAGMYDIPGQPDTSVNNLKLLVEKFKGLVSDKKIRFPSDLGTEHPYDYTTIDQLMLKYGVVPAIVDKHIDFIMASGINIASEDKRSKQIIEDWMRDVDFNTAVRPWIRAALAKGPGYLELGTNEKGIITELKTLKSDYMFKDRDEFGYLNGINQYLKPLKTFDRVQSQKDIERFKTNEIAVLDINRHEDMAYGIGIIYPLMWIINDLVGSRREMHTFMRRKSNSPYIFRGGSVEKWQFPSQGKMDAMKQKLEWLNNKHEWVIPALWDVKTLDFGNLGDKFSFIIENDMEILCMGAQIPAFLMGKASIAEGIAKEQMKAWMFKIQSLREEIEKVIEQQIFKPVLLANGLETHVEIIWGLPTEEEKNEKIKLINDTIKNPFLNTVLKNKLEDEMALLYGIPEDDLLEMEEEREKEEEEELLPVVPEERKKDPSKNPPPNDREHVHDHKIEESVKESRHYTIKEWLGFNYSEYSDEVLSVIQNDPFKLLKGITKEDFKAGLLSSKEIEQVRISLSEAIDNNNTIRELENLLEKRIDFKDRLVMKNGHIVTKNGKPVLALSKIYRANMIARTETVRVSNEGAKEHYKKNDITKVRWIAAMSERTCPICSEFNGRIYPINNTPAIPAHPDCRCTIAPVVE